VTTSPRFTLADISPFQGVKSFLGSYPQGVALGFRMLPLQGKASRPSLNWRGSRTSYCRHLLLIGRFPFDGERNVLLSEGF